MTQDNQDNKTRKRRVTHLALDWLAERMRKCEDIKSKISAGNYQVDNGRVARAIANQEPVKDSTG